MKLIPLTQALINAPCGVCGSRERTGKNCRPCNARRNREFAARNRDLTRRRVAIYRAAHLEDVRARDRERYANDQVRQAATKASLKRYATREARRAHLAVARAIARGLLTRPDVCDACGRSALIDAAHFDYADQLAVRWLCRSCHVRWDKAEPKTRKAF